MVSLLSFCLSERRLNHDKRGDLVACSIFSLASPIISTDFSTHCSISLNHSALFPTMICFAVSSVISVMSNSDLFIWSLTLSHFIKPFASLILEAETFSPKTL